MTSIPTRLFAGSCAAITALAFSFVALGGVMFELKRLYFDTALSANKLIFGSLLRFVSHEQVLFGSDYPYAPEPTTVASIKGLANLELPSDVLLAIERTNALRLLQTVEAA